MPNLQGSWTKMTKKSKQEIGLAKRTDFEYTWKEKKIGRNLFSERVPRESASERVQTTQDREVAFVVMIELCQQSRNHILKTRVN